MHATYEKGLNIQQPFLQVQNTSGVHINHGQFTKTEMSLNKDNYFIKAFPFVLSKLDNAS